jgi:hypothetical protein
MNIKLLRCGMRVSVSEFQGERKEEFKKQKIKCIYRSLSFTFVLNRSFKFFKYQIGLLSFTFVLDKSFKFYKYQIGPLGYVWIDGNKWSGAEHNLAEWNGI